MTLTLVSLSALTSWRPCFHCLLCELLAFSAFRSPSRVPISLSFFLCLLAFSTPLPGGCCVSRFPGCYPPCGFRRASRGCPLPPLGPWTVRAPMPVRPHYSAGALWCGVVGPLSPRPVSLGVGSLVVRARNARSGAGSCRLLLLRALLVTSACVFLLLTPSRRLPSFVRAARALPRFACPSCVVSSLAGPPPSPSVFFLCPRVSLRTLRGTSGPPHWAFLLPVPVFCVALFRCPVLF